MASPWQREIDATHEPPTNLFAATRRQQQHPAVTYQHVSSSDVTLSHDVVNDVSDVQQQNQVDVCLATRNVILHHPNMSVTCEMEISRIILFYDICTEFVFGLLVPC